MQNQFQKFLGMLATGTLAAVFDNLRNVQDNVTFLVVVITGIGSAFYSASLALDFLHKWRADRRERKAVERAEAEERAREARADRDALCQTRRLTGECPHCKKAIPEI